jgi:chloramphenicol O-acetyltransferase
MDGRQKQIKMRFATEELRELYTEFEEDFTDFFDDLRAHAKQINRRIIFFNHKENEVLYGGLRSFNKSFKPYRN